MNSTAGSVQRFTTAGLGWIANERGRRGPSASSLPARSPPLASARPGNASSVYPAHASNKDEVEGSEVAGSLRNDQRVRGREWMEGGVEVGCC